MSALHVIVGNAEWNTGPDYDGLLNGVMMEQFLQGEAEAQKFGWTAVMRTYAHYATRAVEPRLPIVMANRDDAGDTAFMRFALASTLVPRTGVIVVRIEGGAVFQSTIHGCRWACEDEASFLCREYSPTAYPPGGIGTYVRHMTSLLARAGETVHVIAHRWDGAPDARQESVGGRLIVHRVALDEPILDKWA